MKRCSMMMMVAVLCAAPWAGGCASVYPAQQDPIATPPQIMMESPWLKDHVLVQQVAVSRVGAGQLDVHVPLHNVTSDLVIIDYQYTFLGANGAQSEQPSGWHDLRIPPKGYADAHFTSMTPASDFRMQIRNRQ